MIFSAKIIRVTDNPEHDFANLIENEPNVNLTGGVKNYKFATFLQDVADVFAQTLPCRTEETAGRCRIVNIGKPPTPIV